MSHRWMRGLVPREWSGEQALFAAALLRAALDAPLHVHGEAMAIELGDQPAEIWDEVLGEARFRAEIDDDIPF
jgi:lambda repressor-like predicted transcriptional regulator